MMTWLFVMNIFFIHWELIELVVLEAEISDGPLRSLMAGRARFLHAERKGVLGWERWQPNQYPQKKHRKKMAGKKMEQTLYIRKHDSESCFPRLLKLNWNTLKQKQKPVGVGDSAWICSCIISCWWCTGARLILIAKHFVSSSKLRFICFGFRFRTFQRCWSWMRWPPWRFLLYTNYSQHRYLWSCCWALCLVLKERVLPSRRRSLKNWVIRLKHVIMQPFLLVSPNENLWDLHFRRQCVTSQMIQWKRGWIPYFSLMCLLLQQIPKHMDLSMRPDLWNLTCTKKRNLNQPWYPRLWVSYVVTTERRPTIWHAWLLTCTFEPSPWLGMEGKDHQPLL